MLKFEFIILRFKNFILFNSFYTSKVDDGDGKKTRMCLWNHPGKDLTGVITRSRKIVNTCETVSLYLVLCR